MAFNVINALRGAGAAISNAANKAVTKPVSTALSTAGTIAKVVPNPLTPVVNIAKLATPEKTTSLSGTPTSTPTTAPATTTTTVKGGMSTQSPQGGGMSTVGTTKVPSAPSAPQVSNSYQAPAFSASDFTSTDQSIQQRIQDMQKQAQGSSSQSYQAPTQPQSPIAPSTPTANAVSAPQSNSVIDQLRGKINALSAPSAEEQSLQQELAQLRGDAAQGIAGLEGQGRGIPLTLVRGQQAKLGEQAQLQEQTLLDRITAMSAQRQAQLQAAQNEYTMAQAEQERQDALTAPVTVGNQILQFDPATGQYKTLYSAPEQAQQQTANMQEYEYARQNGYTGSFVDYQNALGSSGGSGGLISVGANSSLFDPSTGTFIQAPGSQTATSAEQQNIQDAYSLAQSIFSDSALANAVGVGGAVNPRLPGSHAATIDSNVERLKSLLTLPALQQMKGTGALSDRDVATISASVAALNKNMSVEDFKTELTRIMGVLQGKGAVGGNQGSGTIDVTAFNPNPSAVKLLTGRSDANGQPLSSEEVDYLARYSNYLYSKGSNEQQVQAEINSLMGFNKVGGDTNTASLGTLSEKYESGGNPGAIGYDSTGGWSYGAYQLAGNNAQKFLSQSPYGKYFQGIQFNSKAFQDQWKKVAQADPMGFKNAQKQFIEATHFQPQVQKLAQAGIDIRNMSNALKNVIWSTAVQHGPNTDIVQKALASLPKNASDAQKIYAIYVARWNNGANFRSSTPQVRQSVYNRFFGKEGELATALKSLNIA